MDKNLMIHRFFKIIGRSYYFENIYGIKAYNKKQFRISKTYEKITISPENVFLGFDGLKDKYTLLGRSIPDSPHYDMVKKISIGCDINECEYIVREKQGSLDGRYEMVPNIKLHIDRFHLSASSINKDLYDPVLIYQLDNHFFAIDGKHRLAMCYLMKVPCKCCVIDLDEFSCDEYTNKLYLFMKGKKDYGNNLKHLSILLDS